MSSIELFHSVMKSVIYLEPNKVLDSAQLLVFVLYGCS